MIYTDPARTHALLDYPGLIDALRQSHDGGSLPYVHTEFAEDPAGRKNQFIGLTAWQPGGQIAVKLVGVFPGNLGLPQPQSTIQGIVALFDGETGAPLVTCDGDALTVRKTMAVSGLGATFLARRDARVLLVVGAGGLAPHAVQAHLTARPSISEVLVWNRTRERGEKMVAGLPDLPASVTVVDDLDTAVSTADVISCVTMSTSPLVRGALLKPGAHVDLVGGYMPEMREADDETIRRAGRLFISTWQYFDTSGDVADHFASGLLTREKIPADLYDLSSGRHKGRSSDDEITVFKNIGGAHLDLYAIRYLFERAQAGGAA